MRRKEQHKKNNDRPQPEHDSGNPDAPLQGAGIFGLWQIHVEHDVNDRGRVATRYPPGWPPPSSLEFGVGIHDRGDCTPCQKIVDEALPDGEECKLCSRHAYLLLMAGAERKSNRSDVVNSGDITRIVTSPDLRGRDQVWVW